MQTVLPHSVVSDLNLQFLPVTLLDGWGGAGGWGGGGEVGGVPIKMGYKVTSLDSHDITLVLF